MTPTPADIARRYHRPRPAPARCWRCEGGPVTITRSGIGVQPCPLCGRTAA